MIHQKYVNQNIDEFYRCCFVPIESKLITGNGQGLQNEGGNDNLDILKETIFDSTDFELSYETDANSVAIKIIT